MYVPTEQQVETQQAVPSQSKEEKTRKWEQNTRNNERGFWQPGREIDRKREREREKQKSCSLHILVLRSRRAAAARESACGILCDSGSLFLLLLWMRLLGPALLVLLLCGPQLMSRSASLTTWVQMCGRLEEEEELLPKFVFLLSFPPQWHPCFPNTTSGFCNIDVWPAEPFTANPWVVISCTCSKHSMVSLLGSLLFLDYFQTSWGRTTARSQIYQITTTKSQCKQRAQTDSQTDRQTQTQTDRQTWTDRHGQTDMDRHGLDTPIAIHEPTSERAVPWPMNISPTLNLLQLKLLSKCLLECSSTAPSRNHSILMVAICTPERCHLGVTYTDTQTHTYLSLYRCMLMAP